LKGGSRVQFGEPGLEKDLLLGSVLRRQKKCRKEGCRKGFLVKEWNQQHIIKERRLRENTKKGKKKSLEQKDFRMRQKKKHIQFLLQRNLSSRNKRKLRGEELEGSRKKRCSQGT